jgi:hypothetical protein
MNVSPWNKSKNSDDNQEPEKKSRTWGNAVRTEIRAAGGRSELKQTVNTSTTKWRKQNFPRFKPLTKEGLKAFQDSVWRKKKLARTHPEKSPGPPPLNGTYTPYYARIKKGESQGSIVTLEL